VANADRRAARAKAPAPRESDDLPATPAPTTRGRLLALDVSSTACGWAVMDADGDLRGFGVIRPTGSLPAIDRINSITWHLSRLIYRWGPQLAALEWADGKTARRIPKASGLSVLGAAQGAVYQMFRERAIGVAAVPQNEWTRSRPKASRAERVAILHPGYAAARSRGEDPGFDSADAIGLADYVLGWRG
jgi:Holliday junction resolvasome RuvABC endonuclease subunit